MKSVFKSISIFLFIILGLVPVRSQKLNIAILQFDAANISEAEVRILTDRLSTELVKLGTFNVIERSVMEEVLKEQGFQQSGCVTSECVVEVGKLIGVEQMITGSMGKIGSVYTISARLIDVETGQVLSQKSLDCPCPIETILMESMAEIAKGLTTGEETLKPIPVIPETGSVEFSSNIDSVEVILDSVSIGITPLVLKDQPVGKYEYTARKDNYRERFGVYEIFGGKRFAVDIDLNRREGTLTVKEGRFDQRFNLKVGNKTFTDINAKTLTLPEGPYDITISEFGYYDLNKSVIIEDQKTAIVNALTKPIMVSVGINVTPSTANLKLNSKPIDLTSHQSLRYGDHEIVASATGYHRQSKAFKIDNSNPLTVDLHLKAKSKSRSRMLSTILPGSGQFYSGKPLKGFLYLGLTIGSAYLLNSTFGEYNDGKALMDDYYSLYSSAVGSNQINAMREQYKNQVNEVNDLKAQVTIIGIALAATWAVNIIDVYFFNGLPDE